MKRKATFMMLFICLGLIGCGFKPIGFKKCGKVCSATPKIFVVNCDNHQFCRLLSQRLGGQGLLAATKKEATLLYIDRIDVEQQISSYDRQGQINQYNVMVKLIYKIEFDTMRSEQRELAKNRFYNALPQKITSNNAQKKIILEELFWELLDDLESELVYKKFP